MAAIGTAPAALASWMAASPTDDDAAGMMTASPSLMPAMSSSAPQAVRYCIGTAAACTADRPGGRGSTARAGTTARSPQMA